MRKEIINRFMGAWWGSFIGDAVAMPTHGYSSETLIKKDYGIIHSMLAPNEECPDSPMFKLPTPTLPPEFDYIGERRLKIWRNQFAHPHAGFVAGENTLSLFLAMHMAALIHEFGRFELDKWMERYQAIMTTPDAHNDVFIPSIHRRYFDNLAAGKDPEKNGCPDAHMSDIAMFIPLMFGSLKNKDRVHTLLMKSLRKFAIGETAVEGAFFISEILSELIRGKTLEDILYNNMTPDRHFSLAFPYRRWIKNKDDSDAVNATGRFAVLEESIPLTIYLSLKYGMQFEKAVYTNANIGGESVGRGAIIGMLSGAQCGLSGIPPQMIEHLKYAEEIRALGDMLFQILGTFA